MSFNQISVEWTYGSSLVFSALEDLDHDFVLVLGAELVLELGVGGGVQDTLGAVAARLLVGELENVR